MIRRSTWILLAIFVVLVGIAVILPKVKPSTAAQEATFTPEPTQASVFDLGSEKIVDVRISQKDGANLAFSLGATGWTVSEPQGSSLTSGRLEEAVSELQAWKVWNQLQTVPPLDTIGLDNPAYSIEFKTDNGTSHSITIGNETPTGSGYYVSIDQGNPIVVNKNSVDPVVDLLKTDTSGTPTAPPLPNAPSATMTASP